MESRTRYYLARRDELLKEHPELTTKKLQLQRMKSEWNLMSDEEKKPYMGGKEDGGEVGVEEFMSAVKKERRKEEVDPEFEEDEVLSIVNHKSKWKLTYGRKKKMRLGMVPNSMLRLN